MMMLLRNAATPRTKIHRGWSNLKSRSLSSPCSTFSYAIKNNDKNVPPQANHIHRPLSSTTSSTLTSNKNTPGLFSIPGLHNPCDFIHLAKDAMNRCDTIRTTLTSPLDFAPKATPTQTLHHLDQLSNEVCSVIDAAELCRCVHSSEEWRDKASRAFELLSGYICDLNADTGLYGALCDATDDMSVLSWEERRMGVLLKAEFERDGIHLKQSEREELKRMLSRITQLESEFSGNIVTERKFFPLPAEDVSRIIPTHILHSIIPQQQSTSSSSNDEHNDTVTVSSDAQIVNTLLKYSPNPSLRKEVYMQSHTSCPQNLQVLSDLITCRHELSTKLGFASYADKFLSDKMAKNQKNVYGFLNQMSASVKDGANKEMEMLSRAKLQMEQNGSELQPWDIPFYTGLLKSQQHELDTSTLAPYFSVDNCLHGMKLIVHRLFGITVEEVPIPKEESWVDADPNNNNNTIRKLQFNHETEGPMGTIYLDLHPRPGKYAHAAHFTVRCGCVPTDGTTNTPQDNNIEKQLPIVALVCNLSAPNEQDISHLSHSEVETLFHEFGHALHSLLSRTRFQHLSGTRAAVDFVETPSHLMEHFAWDGRVLQEFAFHSSTGEPIPHDVTKRLEQSRQSFQCLEVQNQTLYALLDQELFGMPKSPNTMSSTDIFEGLHKSHNIPYAKGTHWHSRFGHLVTYGAGYYAYLYAQVFASDIWEHCFAKDPLNRDQGEKLRKEVLIHGGAKDANEMLRCMLGREPTVDAFFRGVKLG